MTSATFSESTIESAALSWFADLGYAVAYGPDLTFAASGGERATYTDVVLVARLRAALSALNPAIPHDSREEALRKILRPDTTSLTVNNRAFHQMLRDGIEVEYQRPDGSTFTTAFI